MRISKLLEKRVGVMFYALAVVLLAVVVSVRIPSLRKTQNTPHRNGRCINNLRIIDSAKEQWAQQNKKGATDKVALRDLAPFCKDGVIPSCPLGGIYAVTVVSANPTCTIPGHSL